MATWLNMSLQDGASPIMEQLVFFHDHVLMIMLMITTTVSYMMITLIRKQTNQTIHTSSTNNWNHMNHCTCNHPCIHRHTIPTTSLPNSRSPQPSINAKSSWTPMMLKMWMLSLHKASVRLMYNPASSTTSKNIPTTSHGQPNRPTYKLTYPINRYSSSCPTLMNNPKTGGKNSRHTSTTKPNKILNQSSWYPLRTVLSNLRSKPQIHAHYNWKSTSKKLHYWVSKMSE
uniref:Cytochrome c oxidase subunit 2 n=1 Tax=Coptotermes testaceus TaxID=280681 RepID=A0A0U2RS00_9NEOP|nr:cytochrome c oxidase subunit II [Coptotermes testaceus]ALP29887.1 cytochrome c oxidase subunit II [Coptotermes testaceus]